MKYLNNLKSIFYNILSHLYQGSFILLFIVIMLMSSYLLYTIKLSQDQYIVSLTEFRLYDIKKTIDNHLKVRTEALERLVDRIKPNTKGNDPHLKQDAVRYLHDFPSLNAIYCIDGKEQVICRFAKDSIPELNKKTLASLMTKSKGTNRISAIVTKAKDLTPQLIMFFPAFHSNSEIKGIIAQISYEELFGQLLDDPNEPFGFTIEDDNSLIFSSSLQQDGDPEVSASTLYNLHDLKWTLTIWPIGEFVDSSNIFGNRLSVAIGVILSVMVIIGFSIWHLERLNAKKTRKLLEIKENFLTNVSHELRTPLNVIVGNSSIMARTELDEKQKKLLGQISTSSDILEDLINNIMDFTKYQTEEELLYEKPCHIHEETMEVIRQYQPIAKICEIGFQYSISSEVPEVVLCDVSKYKQILSKLLSNAFKFTSNGKVSVDLEVSGTKRSPKIRCTVVDTGIGIPEDKIGTIFEQFTQVDPSSTRRYEGLGLGLTIAKHLVTIMQGKIKITSVEGKGTTCWFEVPLKTLSTEVISRA